MTKKSAPFAAIDIGTNSFRLLIAEIAGPDRIRPLVKSLITVRLGAGLHRTKTLAPEAVQRGLTALETFAGAVRSHKPEAVRVRHPCLTAGDKQPGFFAPGRTDHRHPH